MMIRKKEKSTFHSILEKQGFLVLDGGLATLLEALGFNLDHPLWSAKLLKENGGWIEKAHLDYLTAGADCIITASYQATVRGLEENGHSRKEAEELILNSVRIAEVIRWRFQYLITPDRMPPIIAASIGPYGAYLADGSEYRGNYGLSQQELIDFHLPRWEILANSNADLLACETIPSLLEAEALCELLSRTPEREAWISFSCRNGREICEGSPISECVSLIESHPQVLGLGINCTAPGHVSSLIREAKKAGLTKPVIAYPNSGEIYDDSTKTWKGEPSTVDFVEMAKEWFELGAKAIGGCCRTGPEHVRALREALVGIREK